MRFSPRFRVVLLLVAIATKCAAALQFEPLAAPLPLPEPLRGKAIWTLQRLPDGRIGVGFEGGLALGIPAGHWSIVSSPNGSPIQFIAPAHGRILACGGGTAGFIESGAFAPLQPESGHTTAIAAVPEGWLLAGPAGLRLLSPDGRLELRSPDPADQLAGSPDAGEVFAFSAGHPVRRWRNGAFQPPAATGAPAEALMLRDGMWFTKRGVLSFAGDKTLLPAETATAVLKNAGLIGAANTRPWILFATYWQGLLAYAEGAAAPAWSWSAPGTNYTLARDGDDLLLGTAEGAFALASPNRVRLARYPATEILHCTSEAGTLQVVTMNGLLGSGPSPSPAPELLWPEVDGARIAANTLAFHGRAIQISSRFINGLAVHGETAALAYLRTLLVAGPESTGMQTLASNATSLAYANNELLVGTQADGVQRFSLAGSPLGQIGQGQSKLRILNSERTLLLFWNGDIRNAHGDLVAHLPHGAPRDAASIALLRGDGTTAPDQLAVLATQPDSPPVVGIIDQQSWTPLEIPGMAEIDAEALTSDAEHLYVVGRRGVLEVRMPIAPASPPAPTWTWTDGSHGDDRTVPSADTSRVQITIGRWESPLAAPTTYHVRIGGDDWMEATPGVALSIPLAWGRNDLLLQSTRNGLVVSRKLRVTRPYPWPLQPWAIILQMLALAGAGWGIARWRLRHLIHQKRALEAAVAQRTADLTRANAAKEEFLASVSHEIRNPLNGVVGICAILQDSAIAPREKSFVRVLSGCAEQLRSMLDDVLDFSRIDRGEITLSTAPFEIGALVEESTRAMDPTLESCSIERPETPHWLEGDAGKIRQIVCNLVSNALKYGQPRRAGIELRVQPAGAGRLGLRLSVRNTGPTIPADVLPHLFDSFRRGPGTEKTPGVGLGLAVCRRLAEHMGGRISAASADSTTEFALELILPLAEQPSALPVAHATVSHALAIEDEHYNRLALGHALRALGYSVDWAIDGASALQLVRRQPYDLILTDWRLPDIDGDELCRQIQSALPHPRPPIIAVTAYSSAEKLAQARAAGMAGFVSKPITREKLEHAIRTLDTGPRPRATADLGPQSPSTSPLAILGDLAPTMAKLATDLATGWQQTETQIRLRDPRAGRSAHALRSLLLLAEEKDLAEQLGLLENAANEPDWVTADRLTTFLATEINAVRTRLAAAGPH